MNKASKKTAEWWNDTESQPPGTQWVEVPKVGSDINRRASDESLVPGAMR
jgi:hypothetical protein